MKHQPVLHGLTPSKLFSASVGSGQETKHTHHIDNDLSELQPLFLRQAAQKVAVRVLKKFERDGQMVLLQNALVVVHNGQFVV